MSQALYHTPSSGVQAPTVLGAKETVSPRVSEAELLVVLGDNPERPWSEGWVRAAVCPWGWGPWGRAASGEGPRAAGSSAVHHWGPRGVEMGASGEGAGATAVGSAEVRRWGRGPWGWGRGTVVLQ